MRETGEPAGFVSAIIVGVALGFVSYFLLQGLPLPGIASRFAMEELVVLGAIVGVAIHVFGKITHPA